MVDEIRAWLGHLQKLQQIWIALAPGFVAGDLKTFGHQRFSELLPAAILSSDQIAERMEALGALCQRDGIGIPTQTSLQDLNQTEISFINRVSNVSIFPAMIRMFRNVGIAADPVLARFGESSVAGMIVGEVLGESPFSTNPFKRMIVEIIASEFGAANYQVEIARLQARLDSNATVLEIARSIVD